MGFAIVLAFTLFALILWPCVLLMKWIIKTAVKEALREYETENHGPQ